MKDKFSTKQQITWCPGCFNFMVLSSVKKTLEKLKLDKKNTVMTTGIGCHGKIFDYIDISGIYCLHGRPVAVASGIKIGNPKLNVLAFAGDGDTYDEGIAHFIHACKTNPDITLIVHNNQTFALTTGQSTAVSEESFKTKVYPHGEKSKPLNSILLALGANASFVARTSAKNLEHMQQVFEKAIKHKGFSFVEVIQPCLQFNPETNLLDKQMYILEDNKNKEKAFELAREWDYNSLNKKIPLGIFYSEDRETLEETVRK